MSKEQQFLKQIDKKIKNLEKQLEQAKKELETRVNSNFDYMFGLAKDAEKKQY